MKSFEGHALILLFIVGGALFVFSALLLSKVLRPNKPTKEKLLTYESGEDPQGSADGPFNLRFYTIGLIFLLFEAELVFLFPWAIVFGDETINRNTQGLWVSFTLIETLIFIFILSLGLAYVWKNKMLTWIKPIQKSSSYTSKIPSKMYRKYLE